MKNSDPEKDAIKTEALQHMQVEILQLEKKNINTEEMNRDEIANHIVKIIKKNSNFNY